MSQGPNVNSPILITGLHKGSGAVVLAIQDFGIPNDA
jgi:hypothetical protein